MLLKLLPIVIFFFAFALSSFSQSFNIIIGNGVFTNDNCYEFDIIIKTIENDLDLTSYQASLIHYIDDTHELDFSYIPGTSELNNIPSTGIGCLINNGNKLLTFATLPGKDTIRMSERKIGRFLLKSNQNIRRKNPFIFWNFNGDLATIITGSGFNNITSSGSFLPVNSSTVDVDEELSEVIIEYELLQNYPNPFNPSTTIKYKIPFESSVKLKVFNVLGEEVKTLVDNIHSPGVYEVRFDAESLSSGHYIYALYVNNKILENKKLILLK